MLKPSIYNYNHILSHTNLKSLTDYMNENIKNMDTNNTCIPQKSMIHRDNPRSIFISMPALNSKLGLYINKVGTFFERNSEDPLPTINAMLMVYSSITGELIAILDGTAITNLKCAAITSIVTNYCAHPQAHSLAIIGAGVQAEQQIHGVCMARKIKEVFIYNRDKNRLINFMNKIHKMHPEIEITQFNSIADCIKNAQIIATTTSSSFPLDKFLSIQENVHINCMGAHTNCSREIPYEVLNCSQLIVEDIPTAIAEAGIVHANAYDIFQLSKLNIHNLQNCKTIFSSTGYAFLDLVTASFIIHQIPKPK